jgi:hypothetical protein
LAYDLNSYCRIGRYASLIWSDDVVIGLCGFDLEDDEVLGFVDDLNDANGFALISVLPEDHSVRRV